MGIIEWTHAKRSAVYTHTQILLDKENTRVQEMMASLVDKQLTKLDEKMRHFEDLERLVEQQRQQVCADSTRSYPLCQSF